MKNIRFFLLLPLLVLSLGGCLVATQDTIIAPTIHASFKGTYKVDPYLEKHTPLSVAVLPFHNEAASKEGSEEVRRSFYNHFSFLPFRDLEIHRVDDLLQKANLTDPAVINKTSPQELGKILGVDAVIFGTISNFDKLFAVIYSHVSVGAKISMYDTKTGNFLWSGEHVTRIHEGGIATTPVGLIATVIATSMNMRDIQLLRACDDLFRDMVKTIPTPPLAAARRPPAITLLTQDSGNRPRKAGEEIKVVLQGEPKMTAYFQIGDYRKNLELREVEPGWYLGVYKVLPGDNVEKAMITAFLKDDGGNVSSWVDALGAVTLDTTPPEAPARLATVGRNNLILLQWDKVTAPDLAGYVVYRSSTPLSGFQEILRTEVTEGRDEKVTNQERYYYQVAALDRAGNESQRRETVPAMPVAPGPTPAGGTLETDVTWYAGASPYILERDVIVKDRALLTIEPGTRILSRGGALIIEGRLQAVGDRENIIEFAAQEGSTWPGIRFANVKERENHVAFVRISGAATAIQCDASSPAITSSEFTQNRHALRITGAFSQPVIGKNQVHKNTHTAVIISEGARPLLEENRLGDNHEAAILIMGASPVIRHNDIKGNQGGGIIARGGSPVVSGNNIVANLPFNMEGEAAHTTGNWWGSARGREILAGIRGKINVRQVLDAPYPEGKPLSLPILEGELGGSITRDSFLVLAHSPYRVKRDVIVDGGASLFVEPGVVIRYDQNTSLFLDNGGIVALGTQDQPIVFTAGAQVPAPGFYRSAIVFRGRDNKVSSVVRYGIFQFAETALDIHFGAPEITYSYIGKNSQNGVFCRNDSAPRISFSTLADNSGEGGIKVVGMARPVINHNNFRNNEIAHIQAFSTIRFNATHNWWGGTPPDERKIFRQGEDSLNLNPWLPVPESRAFFPAAGGGK
jgi:hypothetical protein